MFWSEWFPRQTFVTWVKLGNFFAGRVGSCKAPLGLEIFLKKLIFCTIQGQKNLFGLGQSQGGPLFTAGQKFVRVGLVQVRSKPFPTDLKLYRLSFL